jgi:hypothetical protein
VVVGDLLGGRLGYQGVFVAVPQFEPAVKVLLQHFSHVSQHNLDLRTVDHRGLVRGAVSGIYRVGLIGAIVRVRVPVIVGGCGRRPVHIELAGRYARRVGIEHPAECLDQITAARAWHTYDQRVRPRAKVQLSPPAKRRHTQLSNPHPARLES